MHHARRTCRLSKTSDRLKSVNAKCRAIVVEVCRRANDVQNHPSTEKWQRQLAALEALQIFAPMGHALGLSRICAELEDRCFQVLSPQQTIELTGPADNLAGARSWLYLHNGRI